MTRWTAAMGIAWGLLMLPIAEAGGREYHVAVTGDDGHRGSRERPLQTISAAAARAQAGDVVTVHAGTYRERVTPPRGGVSDRQRITYQAAPGEKVVIKGSEVVTGWEKGKHDTWRVTVANELFGDFNPYSDLIRGDWFDPKGREHHTGAVYLEGHWLTEAADLEKVLAPAGDTPLWFARVDPGHTTIWAQFESVDPNSGQVEINVRQTVFYPAAPGVDFLTVRGFTMMHAATPWAPPTAEQIGLIGTHWSKGWIIEGNDIRYSTCVGVTLGKYGDRWDNTSQDSAEGYVETIERALENGWSKENIGHHVVRDNEIAHCEQAGIVGSLGAIFSRITGNDIHDIHMRRLFSGAEMAGIKIHAAIDTEIRGNHIYRTHRGIWLDWMAQGARVTRNLLHDNDGTQDLFFEVNHGPFMVDHNICLSVYPPRGESHWQSRNSVLDVSQGGAYAHNLFANGVLFHSELGRETPFMKPHSTAVAGLRTIPGGDNRFYGNLLVSGGLIGYDGAEMPSWIRGNVYLKGARPSSSDQSPLQASFDPGIDLVEKPDGLYVEITLERDWAGKSGAPLVTTELLGNAKVPDLPYLDPDRMPYRLDTDYLGAQRNAGSPFPGPFERPQGGRQVLKVWPMSGAGPGPAERPAEARRVPAAFAPIIDDPGLPRVLLLGDSISIGYTLPVRERLKGRANVHRPAANCGPSSLGLERLDEWLGPGPWDVIHFNWGLHDLKYMGPGGENLADPRSPDSHQQVPIVQYQENLRALASRLQGTGARLIWCSTTPVPEGAAGRVAGDAARYNSAAARVMESLGIPTNDLFAVARPLLAEIQRPANVHFTPEGSGELGERVARAILAAID